MAAWTSDTIVEHLSIVLLFVNIIIFKHLY